MIHESMATPLTFGSLISRSILAIRPKTLSAAAAPILCTTAFVFSTQRDVSGEFFIRALFTIVFLQAATNLFNDALDFKKGADTHARLGPIRVTASGLLKPRVVFALAFLFLSLSVLMAWPLILKAGTQGLVIAIVSAFFSYGYTGGPYPLAYKGLGELFVMIFFGWVACMGLGVLVFDSQAVRELFLLGTQVGALSTVLISINNFRDFKEDRSNQKWTLAARFGLKFARLEIAFFILLPFVLSFFWLGMAKPGALLVWICFPLARRLVSDILKETPDQTTNRLLVKSAKLQLLFSVALSIGFLVW
jgi:1,4-dihydroxy-2-naphthoate octaprenyltransferase